MAGIFLDGLSLSIYIKSFPSKFSNARNHIKIAFHHWNYCLTYQKIIYETKTILSKTFIVNALYPQRGLFRIFKSA